MTIDAKGFVTDKEIVVHEWAMFQLVQRHVTSPQGVSFERTFVHTPGAVATVAVSDSGDIALVEQYRASFGGYVLEIPAGMRDVEGEDPAVTARRELREEAGVDASHIELLGECLSSPGVTDSSVLVYVATGLTQVAIEPHGPEEDEMLMHWVPLHKAVMMVENGDITDAKSAYGILLAVRRYPELVRE
jgi:ADP-ribose pyrophosphatase